MVRHVLNEYKFESNLKPNDTGKEVKIKVQEKHHEENVTSVKLKGTGSQRVVRMVKLSFESKARRFPSESLFSFPGWQLCVSGFRRQFWWISLP